MVARFPAPRSRGPGPARCWLLPLINALPKPCGGGFCSGAHLLLGPARLLSLGIRLTFDDKLIGRVLEAIDRALGEHRIGHDVEPFTRLPVGVTIVDDT